jgi:hypothetical protein
MMTNNNVQSALTDRDNLDSKIDLLRDVVTHLLDDTLESSEQETRELADMARNVQELMNQLIELKEALC